MKPHDAPPPALSTECRNPEPEMDAALNGISESSVCTIVLYAQRGAWGVVRQSGRRPLDLTERLPEANTADAPYSAIARVRAVDELAEQAIALKLANSTLISRIR